MVSELAVIFKTPLRIRTLAYLLRTPPATAVEVGKAIHASRPKVVRELKALVRAGIVLERPPKSAPRYTVNEAHALVPHLRSLLIEAMSPEDKEVLAAFRSVPGILFLVVSGILSRDDRSPVDILLICKNPHSRSVPRAVGKVERLAGLPIRYSVMDLVEYQKRRQSYDRMLRDTLDFDHRVLIMRLPEGLQAPLG